MRLIDADWLKDLLLMHEQNARAIEASGRKTKFTYADGIRTGYADAGLCPTIEAEPIRRGKWKECKYAIPIPMETLHIADGIMFCSECEYLALQRLVYEDGNGDLKFIKSNYCPNCGAKMEE